jgi:crossover junction endodeoxyribonuclease RusA
MQNNHLRISVDSNRYGVYNYPKRGGKPLKELNFIVEGDPVPKGRPRLGKGRIYTPRTTKAYEKKVAAVALVARQCCRLKPFKGPVEVIVEVVQAGVKVRVREMQHGTKSTADLDNICKSVLDGMNGVIYDDDRQVHVLKAWK